MPAAEKGALHSCGNRAGTQTLSKEVPRSNCSVAPWTSRLSPRDRSQVGRSIPAERRSASSTSTLPSRRNGKMPCKPADSKSCATSRRMRLSFAVLLAPSSGVRACPTWTGSAPTRLRGRSVPTLRRTPSSMCGSLCSRENLRRRSRRGWAIRGSRLGLNLLQDPASSVPSEAETSAGSAHGSRRV